jgi:adenosine deaminase
VAVSGEMMDWFDTIPKVELHVHLEGAIPLESLFTLIHKYTDGREIADLEALKRKFQYKDFQHFIDLWSWKDEFLREYEDFEYISEQAALDMKGQNIRYAEMLFSPSAHKKEKGLSITSLVEAVRKGLDKVHGIDVKLIIDLVRNYLPEYERQTLEEVKELKSLGVTGIGLGGSEHKYGAEVFEEVFRLAQKYGFHTNAHAGEAAGPESIWGAINVLGVERIGHGTRAIEDDELMNHILHNNIAIELCPISNLRTHVVDSLSNHPIHDYFKSGHLISVNTDDPKMFNTSLANECRLLSTECGYSKKDICKLILGGIRSSWMSEEMKRDFIKTFESCDGWVQ